jgi:hypothetical protein
LILVALPEYLHAQSRPTLSKYLQPANITKLDWVLLQAQVLSLSKDIRWDDYGLIESVSVFAINERALVGMSCLVNKQRYIALGNVVVSKIFADVIARAADILKLSIPEVDSTVNVEASFVAVGGEIVAQYARPPHIRAVRAILIHTTVNVADTPSEPCLTFGWDEPKNKHRAARVRWKLTAQPKCSSGGTIAALGRA